MSLREAIQRYHDLLSDDLAAASQAQLEAQQVQRGLTFSGRPLCTVLRPRFMTPEQYRFLQSRMSMLLRAFDKAYRAAMQDDAIRKQFGLLPWEEELIHHDPGFRDPSPTSRVDTFFVTDRGGLRLTEYNAETPASPAYNDALADVSYGLPVMREFLREYEVRPLPARHSVMHALIDAYQQWAGHREAPRIAILDWREVPSYSEFVLFAEYFRSQGIDCIIADPREVEYRDGKLVAGDYHITLIYKRVLISELIERGGLDHPVVRAVRDRVVCMVNSFRCKILFKKASLAVLSDEQNAAMLTDAQRQAVAKHVPWTRVLEERKTTIDGTEIDLVPYVLANKDALVLKPNDDYGGKGIILGWTVDQNLWQAAVRAALETPHVVQRKVRLPYEPFPGFENGTLHVLDRMLDTNPYVALGSFMHG